MTTQSKTAVRSPHPADAGSGPSNAHARARTRARGTADSPPATDSDRRSGVVDRLARLWTPPQPWTHRPAALSAMYRYACRGGWTGPDGAARRAGVWWCRLVALPVCLVTHYTAWVVARPSRALTVALVTLLAWLSARS